MNFNKIIFLLFLLVTDNSFSATIQKKIVGLMPVRNEARTIAQHIKALSLVTDALVILDDFSSDNTLEIIKNIADECHVESIITKTAWFRDEPGDRNRLLQEGRKIGGTHFVCLDADELFTAPLLKNNFLRKVIYSLKPGERLALVWIQLWRSTSQFRYDTSVWTNNYKDFAFGDDKKCSYNSEFIHTPRCPMDLLNGRRILRGYTYGVLHFEFVNWYNLLVKQAWYRCLERIRKPHKLAKEINDGYGFTKDETDIGLVDAPHQWFEGYDFFDLSLYEQRETWRKKEINQWFKEFGKEYFQELDIWDIDWQVQS